MKRIKGQLVKKSFRLTPMSVECLRILREQGGYRSDGEIIDLAIDALSSQEGLDLDVIRYQVWKQLEENKNLQ